MTITLRAILDDDVGTELGVRVYDVSSPGVKIGSDLVLDQNSGRDSFYEKFFVSLSALTEFTVDLYNTNGSGTLTTQIGTDTLYVGADGGAYLVGSTKENVSGLTVSGPSLDEDGNLLLKRGSKATLDFTGLSTITMSDILFGVQDSSGRSMLKLEGSIQTTTSARVNISADDAMNLIAGKASFDLFQVDDYGVKAEGHYTDAEQLATGEVTISDLFVRLEYE